MELTIEMPVVTECAVVECAYNRDSACHARAITIGDGVHPGCDTFLHASPHTREAGRLAGVGACKVSPCAYNEDYECNADSIRVGFSADAINCLTFSPR